jgi:hypothetical protein
MGRTHQQQMFQSIIVQKMNRNERDIPTVKKSDSCKEKRKRLVTY